MSILSARNDRTSSVPDSLRTDLAHTGPGTLAGRYMRMFWQPVCVSDDLPSGRAVPIRIMSEQFTLYRGETGAAHVLAFRCAHRGSQLSTGWVEGDSIRCFYHGWTYDASGQCIDQPAEPEPFCEKVRLRSYPTQEHAGLIFVYFGEGEPPPLPRHPELESKDAIVEARASIVYPCNYFNRIDNATDMSHTTFAHFGLRHRPEDGFKFNAPTIEARETEYGALIVGEYAGDPVQKVHHYFMPNYNEFGLRAEDPAEAKSRVRFSWKVPLDDSHAVNFLATRIYLTGEAAERYRSRQPDGGGHERSLEEPPLELVESMLAGRLYVQDLADRPEGVALGDLTTMVGQGVIADRANDRLGRSDAGVILVRKMWERELRALAEGRPLKQWARPVGLEMTEWSPKRTEVTA